MPDKDKLNILSINYAIEKIFNYSRSYSNKESLTPELQRND